MSELNRLESLRDEVAAAEGEEKQALEDKLKSAIAEAVKRHPVKQVGEAAGWTRQKIYRHIEVPSKPIGPGLRSDQWETRIQQLKQFYTSHGRVPRFSEDKSLSRWLSNCRAAARGRPVTSVVINDERLAELDEAAPGWRDPRGKRQ